MKKRDSNDNIEATLKYEGLAKYMPLIICSGFYLLTILLFIFGPYDWSITNSKQLYIFLFLNLFFLIFGYVIASFKKIKPNVKKYNINKVISISFAIFIIIYVLNTYSTTGKIYPDIIRGLFNSGEAYRIAHGKISGISVYSAYLNIIFSPIISLIIPIFFIYNRSLSRKSKIFGIVCLILNLFLGIAQGIINAYATFVFEISLFLILYLFSTLKNNKPRKKIGIVFTIIALVLSFFAYYKIVMSNRLIHDSVMGTETIKEVEDKKNNDKNVKIDNEKEKNLIIYNIDTKNADVDNMFAESSLYNTSKLKKRYFLSFLPNNILSSLNHIVSYLTHGYKGLSYAMQEDFTSSYGLGFSDFFRHNFLKIIGKSNLESRIYSRTYMYKIASKGWDTGAVWSTFFIYPASDIGFGLTILLTFLIGFILNMSYRSAVESKNIFAAVIFIKTCMIVCFFSANNVFFQDGGSFLTIFIIGLLWLLTSILGRENNNESIMGS